MARRSRTISLILASVVAVFYVFVYKGHSLQDVHESTRHYSSRLFNSGSRGDLAWGRTDEIRSLIYWTHKHPNTPLPLEPGGGLLPATFGADSKADHALWARNVRSLENESPVTIFSKTYCPYSRRAKALIESYDIHPKPIIIEVDLREDADVIKQELVRLTGRGTFPNVLLKAESIGGSDDVHSLHEHAKLKDLLIKAGVAVRGTV